MVRIRWYANSKKIIRHFRDDVFKPGYGPDFSVWLLNETGGIIVYVDQDPYLEFVNEEDLVMFTLRWR